MKSYRLYEETAQLPFCYRQFNSFTLDPTAYYWIEKRWVAERYTGYTVAKVEVKNELTIDQGCVSLSLAGRVRSLELAP